MKNKGFTLIELLAVIVVLAIISLIAIPIIANVIDKAKEGSAIDSSYGYIDALEKNVALGEIDSSKGIRIPSSNTLSMGDIEGASILESLKIKGTKPDYVEVTFEHKKVKTAGFCIDGYNLEYKNKEIVKSSTNYCGLANVKNIELKENNNPDIVKEGNEYYLNLVPNSTYQLNPTLDPDDNTIPIQYKSNDESIATVSNTGLINALLTGSTKIIVHAGTKVISVNVSVIKPSLVSVLMNKRYSQEDNTDSITIEDVTYDMHVYYYNGNQDWTTSTVPNGGVFGGSDDVASGTAADAMAKKMVAVVVNGDLTIGEGVTITPYYSTYGGPKGFTLIVKGTLTNNGTIDNSHGAYAEGEKVYLWHNAEYTNEDDEYEFVPAVGGAGGARVATYGKGTKTANGLIGVTSDIVRGTGGGGSGSSYSKSGENIHAYSGAGGTGTSYSGGAGGGNVNNNDYRVGSLNGKNGSSVGGAGGSGIYRNSTSDGLISGGGAGNPGGVHSRSGVNANANGKNGTGGLLIIYSNILINESTGKITAVGSNGGCSSTSSNKCGGSSGGGSINIFYKDSYVNNNVSTNNGINANGGSAVGSSEKAGPGGNGSITIGSIKTGIFVANS